MGRDCLEEIEDITAALANFDKALSISPGNIKALENKAKAQMTGGMPDEATKTYLEIIGIEPINLRALLTLADIATDDDDSYGALDRLLVAVKNYPEEPRVYKRLARLYDSIGDEDAADHYRSLEQKYRKKK